MVRKRRASKVEESILCAGFLALRAREKAWRHPPVLCDCAPVFLPGSGFKFLLLGLTKVDCSSEYPLKLHNDMYNRLVNSIANQQLGLPPIQGPEQ